MVIKHIARFSNFGAKFIVKFTIRYIYSHSELLSGIFWLTNLVIL